MFVERIFAQLEGAPAAVTEMHGAVPRATSGRALLGLVAQARAALRERGLSPGARVALVAPNSTQWVAADLAVLAEGLVCVPLYARQSPRELVQMMRDCSCSLVVTVPSLVAPLREAWSDAPLVALASLFGGEARVDAPPTPHAAGTPCTLVYTSGTSGEPKGARIGVSNVDAMLATTTTALGALTGDVERERVFHYLPFCFMGSRIVLWSCLLRAADLRVSTDLDDLARELAAAQPHWFLNVPALLERVKRGVEGKLAGTAAGRALAVGMRAHARHEDGSGALADRAVVALARRTIFPLVRARIGRELRALVCGSAPLAPDTQRWFDALGLPVHQVYGLTETTAIVSMDAPRDGRPGTVGRAIDGCVLRLGENDELLVRGEHVFDGYWEKPDATERAFLELEGETWFRTGDQAEVDADGRLRIVGRTSHVLVPESGHNVAPEPIEESLRARLPGAEHVVVLGHGRPHLAAIVTGAVTHDAVREAVDALNAELPHYRRIRAFHVSPTPLTIESGMLTANQKVRRRVVEQQLRAAVEQLYG